MAGFRRLNKPCPYTIPPFQNEFFNTPFRFARKKTIAKLKLRPYIDSLY
jgi:hypothetical protein